MKQIILTKGYVALVDDEDHMQLAKWKWRAEVRSRTVYGVRTIEDPIKRTIYMHSEILVCTEVDHRDGNGLNNQRSNLRMSTRSQNQANRRKTHGSSRFKGVCRHQGRWMARIKFQGRGIYIGVFDQEEDAARAYDVKAKELFGEFALPNF